MEKLSYQIPDLDHPFPPETRGKGPSGPLRPFSPTPLDPKAVIGRIIDDWTPFAGTYGTAGPGFLGFRLGDLWLIVGFWGSTQWFRLDGRMLVDYRWESERRPMPWEADPDVDFKSLFLGQQFTHIEVTHDSITATFDNGQLLQLSSDPNDRHRFSNGKPMALTAEDDLRTMTFTAPTAEIWV